MGLKVKNQILGIFLLLSFIAYNSGSTLFEHSHIIDGRKITHSHPYQSDTNHEHSESSLLVLSLISNCVIAITIAIFAFQCFLIITATYQVLNEKIRLISDKLYLQLRAPPVLYTIG